jgi:subtilase family serine protease
VATSLCFAVQPDRITTPIDATQMVALKGNMHGLAQARFDLGRADAGQQLHGVTLAFHPSAAQQQDLDNLLAQQQNRASANYHKWLTPAQFADRFGMTRADIARISAWLESQGLTVTSVANSRNQISFEGTVGQVEATFATEIHQYQVNGELHFANATEPSVPAALAGSVLGIGHLHNFNPRPRIKVQPHFTSAQSGNHFLTPGDFATIYDIGPLYNGGIDGTGETIAIIGQSAVSTTDLSNFRTNAGLTASTPQFILYPSNSISTHCSGDEGESDLDLEWSGGVAKNASIIFVYAGLLSGETCTGNRSYSIWDALLQTVDNNYAPVISTSYGFCESGSGSTFTNTVRGWAQQANTQGQTILAAAGDDGAADCDYQVASATQGFAVDMPASIPEVTGLGGTEFNGDTAGTVTGGNSGATTYWSGTTGGTDAISSALSYIPEMAWNDSTADIAAGGTIAAGGGGASIYFTKNSGDASWQTGTGVPNDGKRDVPDLSMTASADHDGYLFCSTTDGAGNAACTKGFRDSSSNGYLDVVGGTSAAAPTFAGIVALLNQYLQTTGLGNLNPTLYSLAATASPSPFHDVTVGNNIVPCTNPSTNCPTTAPFQFGFSAGVGYDQATGLGSVDAHALALAWAATLTPTTTALVPSTSSVVGGLPVTLTATVTPSTVTGTVNFYVNGSTSAIGSAAVSSGVAALTTTALPYGTDNITASYSGNSGPSTSTAVTVTVAVPDFALTVSSPLTPASVPGGQSATATLTVTPVSGAGTLNFAPSNCSGLPSGATCSFSNAGVVTFGGTNPNGTINVTVTTAPNMTVPSGAQTITITGTESGTGGTTHTAAVSLTITATNQSFTLTSPSATFSVAAGMSAVVNLTVNGTNGFVNSSSNTTSVPVSYTCAGLPSQSTCTFSPGTTSSAAAVTMTIATTAKTALATPPAGHGSRIFYALLLPGMFGIVLAAGSRTRGARLLGMIVVLGLSTMWLGSCGGSSGSQSNGGTAPGNYSVVVTGTTAGPNALTASYTVALTVTQ